MGVSRAALSSCVSRDFYIVGNPTLGEPTSKVVCPRRSICGSLLILIEQNNSREYLTSLVTGQKNYFYFKADFKNVRPGQNVPLRAITRGKVGMQAIVMISPWDNHGDENHGTSREDQ